ncbi:unnamed protein product [Rotaria sp. Silwood1]|nr:unnamed protein product [Rotaria sp. Silwood1]CAF1270966.1 unnamed protein product [Rotaria sp. Silwood1]CAF3507534.1 unnamed protein product [Rotaria sp. Silwood1]CAF4504168.1 unnamed protein product [Rotaria sp. Silwood1]CAF4589282.1 unnamed protein product [Rotaria sp. Silwood1]
MSNESHPSPTGSSSSSLFGGGGSNTAGVSGPSPYPSPSKPTWAQILNSNPNTSSNTSASSTTVTANTAATACTTGNNSSSGGGGIPVGNSLSSSSPSSQQSTTLTSAGVGGTGGGGAHTSGSSGITSTTTSISSSQVTPSNSGTFNFPGSRTGFIPNFYEQQQQQSQMNWSLNFNQTSSWMIDDDAQRHSNIAGSSSQQSVDSNHNTPGGGDGFDRLESSSPTPDWGKPVTTNNSAANGWSNFQQQQQQQQTLNNPSRSNTVGNSNTTSNQWPEMNNFYGNNSSTNVPFNLPQNNNDNMNNNSASTTWQDPSMSGNANDTLTLTTGSSNSSIINKHKSSSSSSMAASLSGALKSAIALGGANVDLLSGTTDPTVVYVPQPKLVEQLGWDEPDIKVTKRANFDDGTSIWGDPMDLISIPVKKWTNGTKAALTNSTNIILPQQPSIVQKPVSTNMPTSNPTTSTSQMVLNDENWTKQQSPTLPQQSTSQWNDTSTSVDQGTPPPTSQTVNYRTQQPPPPNNWHAQSQQSTHHGSDDWFRDGVVDTSDWGLQGSQSKVPFDPYEGQVDTSSWGVQGGASGGMGGPLGMPPMNRNRFMNDYDLSENAHDPHALHRMTGYESQSMADLYRQGSDLKNPIIGLGGLLPSSGNPQPHHMLPPSQLPFAPRPGPLYQPNSILRPMNPNSIPTPSGAIMGTGSLISPKLSTTSPVPNQAPYVPLAAKQSNIPTQSSQTPTSQQQPPGTGPVNNGAVHAQIMQQFRLAVQAGLISQDLLNTKLPPYMLQLLQKLFELQQKYQSLSIQLSDFSKHKQRFPITFFQTEYERLSKLITQKKQEMLAVQKQIQDAHAKLIQQQSAAPTPTPTQMMSNGPVTQTQPPPGVSSTQSQDQLAERMQHSLNVDQSRLHQWTKQQTSTRGPQSSSSMFGPPGLTQKDWQTSGNNPNENWENTQTNEPNNNNNNQVGNIDPHAHNNQASSAFGDTLSEFVDDTDGPPPFIPGQLWNWKASLPNAEDDPHVTPSSLTMGPKGPSSSMSNLNVGGAESAFSNPQLLHHMHRQQANRSQWQQSLHDQQGFQPSMNDWVKPHQYRGTSKLQPSLNHPPPPHASFGGYRPYM